MKYTLCLLAVFVVLWQSAPTSASTACCYQFSNRLTVPRIVWNIGTASISNEVAIPQPLKSADGSTPPGACNVLGADVYDLDDAIWVPLERSRIQRIFTVSQSHLELGPLVPSTGDRNYLIQSIQGKTLRLALECQDNRLAPSCVLFDVLIQDLDAAQSTATLDVSTDTPRMPCARSASPTTTPTPSVTRTPSATPSVTPTAQPEYGPMFRWTLSGPHKSNLIVEAGLNYDNKSVSVCPAQLSALSATSMLILHPADLAQSWNTTGETKRHQRGTNLAQYYADQAALASRLSVSVVWDNGGYCRFFIYQDRSAQIDACRVYDADDNEYVFTGGPYTGIALDYRTHKLCASEIAQSVTPSPSLAGIQTPSASAAPVRCSYESTPSRIYRIHRGTSAVAEIKLSKMNCSDTMSRFSLACATRLHILGPQQDVAPSFGAVDLRGIISTVEWSTENIGLQLDSTSGSPMFVLTGSEAENFEMTQTGLPDSFAMITPCESP